MQPRIRLGRTALLLSLTSLLSACVTTHHSGNGSESEGPQLSSNYAERIPQTIASNEKTIIVDPRVHVWGAYENGQLIKAGIASAGSDYCHDLGKQCHTRVGSFRVQSLGGPECVSHIFPVGIGGAPMPYCMFFNNGQALHGVPPSEVGEGNFSHGCVRMQVSDAEWVRYDFANIGTKVIVRPY
jgi:lipoprotein-anchoring transpeptidase ErfK/SrfK